MKNKILCFLVLSVVLLTACSKTTTISKDNQKKEHKIYYLDKNETKIVSEPYEPVATEKEELVTEYLTALKTAPDKVTYKMELLNKVEIKDYSFDEDGQLTINFDSNYISFKGIREILYRAVIVKTLCQIKDVKYVEFNINGQPLMNSSDKPVGLMTSEDFIDNAGGETDYYQKALLTLFFANNKGDKLVESHIRVTYDGTIPMEQLIIEQIIHGPIEEEQYPTIPKNTSVIKITTKESICYVDFSQEFLDKIPEITDEVAIYSIVNSLIESPNVNKVQFLIDGEIKKTYREGISLDGFFERNLDIVEAKK